MKYVVVKYKDQEYAIVFPEYVTHRDTCNYSDVVSAGFFYCGSKGVDVRVMGESISLHKKSRPEDAFLIRRVLLNPEYHIGTIGGIHGSILTRGLPKSYVQQCFSPLEDWGTNIYNSKTLKRDYPFYFRDEENS